MSLRFVRAAGLVLVLMGFASTARAQSSFWELYADFESNSICDVVNAANLELVVLRSTGQLVSVTGIDTVFVGTFVDEDGFVTFLGFPAGFIDFAEDADGFRTLWWFTGDGDVANVNEFTGEPTSSGVFPFDFSDVPCDACPFWDDASVCTDTDLDGIEDIFDLCPETLLIEVVDIDGCSCSQLDTDLDGIDDCQDFCPFTPILELADLTGCSCSQLDDDGDSVDNCFDICPGTGPGRIVDLLGCACSDLDSDLDGINDCLDLCPNTPPTEVPDADGCACRLFDDDQDGVDNCLDACPNTPLSALVVDVEGCSEEVVIIVDDSPSGDTVVNICGSASAMIFLAMMGGLVGLKRVPRFGIQRP